MTKLMKSDQQVDTVFELLGTKENDMTFSLGWTLAKCDVFNQQLATTMFGLNKFSKDMHIKLQEYDRKTGVTDIEIVDQDRVHIIIEAKRGFDIPPREQLEKYADRLLKSPYTKAKKMLVVLAKSDREEKWLKGKVQNRVKVANRQVEVKAISWRQFQKLACDCIEIANENDEKQLLRQFSGYLDKLITRQNPPSNLVYVVSAKGETIDLIEKRQKYFNSMGMSWSLEPPDYFGFRYGGKLQSIHPIKSRTEINDYQELFNKPSRYQTKMFYLYELGAAIPLPKKEIRTNPPRGTDKAKKFKPIYQAAYRECLLCHLLNSDSIAEACEKTKNEESYKIWKGES